MGFNVSVDFKNLGGFPAQGHVIPDQGMQPANAGPATGGGQNRTYEDGYNWVNAGGNPEGSTTYWGYDNRASQYNEAAATLTLHSTSSDATASSNDRDDNPSLGFEITYNLELSRSESWRWGLEGAFGYMNVSVHDSRTLSANATRISDTFQFPFDPETGGPVTPPLSSSYSGPYTPALEGTPFLGDSPSRQTQILPGGAAITGQRSFDANVFGFRFGPYLDIPLSESVMLTFSGGLALAQVASDFSYHETVTLADIGSVSRSGSGSHADLQVGYYAAGNVAVALNEDRSWQLFGGVQFQDLGHYEHKLDGKAAVLDLGQAIFVALGVSYSF